MTTFNIEIIADKLGKSLEQAAERAVNELNQAVRDLAFAAHANIVAHVQASQMDDQNRRDYIKSLNFTELSENSYLIHLEGKWPNDLEEGFSSYDMRDTLLKSEKIVGMGSRVGEPWVRTGKDGKKWAVVPFSHRPYAAKEGDLDADIKKLFAKNRQGKEQQLTKTFTDGLGKPIAGKVASVSGEGIPDDLQGLTKYQHVSKAGKVSSLYTTFRVISENSTGWQHPGWVGHHFFDKVEKEVERELENIIMSIL